MLHDQTTCDDCTGHTSYKPVLSRPGALEPVKNPFECRDDGSNSSPEISERPVDPGILNHTHNRYLPRFGKGHAINPIDFTIQFVFEAKQPLYS